MVDRVYFVVVMGDIISSYGSFFIFCFCGYRRYFLGGEIVVFLSCFYEFGLGLGLG